MKRKLLTVLLAVVMVFGVFGLTACGGSNADADYNYYGVKYEIEDEVKIEAVTFQAVYKMFTTAGSFLLYVDSGADKANYQAINKLANDWNVTIYHFNPDLTGGYAKDVKEAQNANLCSDLTGVAAESQLKAVQDLLCSISGKKVADWKGYNGKLLAITGADSTADEFGTLTYKGKVSAANTVADGAKSIAAIAIKNPSYGAYTEEAKDVPYIPAAYNTGLISTMNLFADARLHIYDDRDAITEEKTDVFVTVANYEMFAHLLDNNEGYFAVFFGGTWCPNTQAILYHVNYLAKDYGMSKVYFFDPRLDDGVRLDQVATSKVFSTEKAYEDEMYNIPALEKAALKAADAVEEAEEALAANTDDSKVASLTKAVESAEAALALAEKRVEIAEANIGYTVTYTVQENKANITGNLNTRNNDATGSAYNYNYTYGSFLANYLPTYWSEWNITAKLSITVDGVKKDYTRMCVPNIMMFNGEAEGKAELIALAEAEYVWANTSVEGNPYRLAWEAAVKEVYDANPYAKYAPVLVVEEAAADAPAAGGSAPAASADSAC